MLSLILAEKILSLFLIMGMGFALVRSGRAKPQDSRGLALANLYVISPCMLVSAFQTQMSEQVGRGFLLALAAGCAVQVLYIALARVLRRPLRLQPVESASVIYSNAGNLIIPLVTWVMGQDMVIYCTAYMVFQTLTMFSHGKGLVRGVRGIDPRQMFLSLNMLAVYLGAALFLLGVGLPGPVASAVSAVGGMIGPSSMLVTGMIMGGVDFRRMRAFKRLPLVVALRLVAFPLAALALLKFAPVGGLVGNADMVLLVTLLASCSPSASTINQFAQIYDKDAEHTSAINVVIILCCIVTMPLMVALYQL